MSGRAGTGTNLAILLFTLVAIAHLLRVVFNVGITVGTWVVPQWVSVLAVIVPGGIAWALWKEHH